MPPTAEARDRRTVLIVILSTLLVLAVVTAGSVALLYRHLDGRLAAGGVIKHAVKKSHQPKAALNLLLLGVDTRACQGCGIDAEKGADGSDTTILLHLAERQADDRRDRVDLERGVHRRRGRVHGPAARAAHGDLRRPLPDDQLR